MAIVAPSARLFDGVALASLICDKPNRTDRASNGLYLRHDSSTSLSFFMAMSQVRFWLPFYHRLSSFSRLRDGISCALAVRRE